MSLGKLINDVKDKMAEDGAETERIERAKIRADKIFAAIDSAEERERQRVMKLETENELMKKALELIARCKTGSFNVDVHCIFTAKQVLDKIEKGEI